MLYTSVTAQDGRVGVAGSVSKDLVSWERPWPVYLTSFGSSVPRQVESSAVHRHGDRFLLFYTQNTGTHVVAGDNSRDFMGGKPKMVWETVAAVDELPVVEAAGAAFATVALQFRSASSAERDAAAGD